MKKRWAMLLLTAMALLMFAGCGVGTEKTESGAVINKDYSEKTMTTVSGEDVDVANTVFALGATNYGYAMVYPQSWKEIPDMNLYLARDDNVCVASYVPQEVVNQLTVMADSDITETEMAQASALLEESLIPFAALCALEDKQSNKPTVLADYHASEEIATANGYTYVLYYNTAFDYEELSEADTANLTILAESVETMANNVVIFPPQAAKESEFAGHLASFNAKDMNGKAVNQSVFTNYDLTMVNIWTTWCSYCIKEMDGLEALYKQLPENVNMLTVCVDAQEEMQLAEEILDKTGATFQTLVGNDSLQETVLQYVSGYPTTVFVDKDGNVVGDVQQGAPGRDVVAGYQALIENRLALVNE